MKFIDKVISDCYRQTYVIVDYREKNEILDLCREEILASTHFEFLKGSIFKYDSNNIEIVQNIDKEIQNSFIFEITLKLEQYVAEKNIVFASDLNKSLLGSLSDNNPITIIFSYCYSKKGSQINIPELTIYENKVPNYYIEQVINEILITLHEYELIESNKVDDLSEILIDFKNEDTFEEKNDYLVDVRKFTRDENFASDDFDGLGTGTYYLFNQDSENYTITIKKIYEKQLHNLDDKIVKKMELIGIESKKQFLEYLNKYFGRTKIINSGFEIIFNEFAKVNHYTIDKYVLKHFQIEYDENKTIEEQLTSEQYNMLSNKFVSAWIYANHLVDDSIVDYDIMVEYGIKKLLNQQESIEDFADFYETTYSVLVIYDFCVSVGLIERIKK